MNRSAAGKVVRSDKRAFKEIIQQKLAENVWRIGKGSVTFAIVLIIKLIKKGRG
jgi:hypothetical protein